MQSPPPSALSPSTPLFRSSGVLLTWPHAHGDWAPRLDAVEPVFCAIAREIARRERVLIACFDEAHRTHVADRKSTRLNSSHVKISYAVFCVKKQMCQIVSV